MPISQKTAANAELRGKAPEKVSTARVDVEETLKGHKTGREGMKRWLELTQQNVYLQNADFRHTLKYWLGKEYERVDAELTEYGEKIPAELEPAAAENDFRFNNPRIDPYNGIGERIDRVVHHPSYADAGDVIYGSDIVKRLVKTGGLREGMGFYYISCHGGEAGHTCPVICNFETARLLRNVDDFPGREHYINKLETSSYRHNYTASQFLTEVQGGSDVGANATSAWQDEDGQWRIRGEKWFCSNADAELMVISARYSDARGTKGLSVFLVPSHKPDGSRNDFTYRRLKEKMGTKALASAEIDFRDTWAIPLGSVDSGFNRMMEQVIHHSRIALAVAVLGFSNRSYQQARHYADTRKAFGQTIVDYPLVQENLADIKANINASLAGTFALIGLQDQLDTGAETGEEYRNFSRLMSNIGKSVISRRAVDDVHHCIDTLGGNGAIETTSSLPRLFRDTVIHENWEGTHNTLYAQVTRDILRYGHDKDYVTVIDRLIASLPEQAAIHSDAASEALFKLQNLLQDFHQTVPELQSLKAKVVVEKMANLFYFVSGIKEAYDQQQTTGKESKLAAVEWYRLMYFTDSEQPWSKEKLQLMAIVIGAEE